MSSPVPVLPYPGPGNASTLFPPGGTLVQTAADWTTGERFAVFFGVAVFASTLLALAVLNWHRAVPYVKIKGLPFVNAIVFCASLFWFTLLTSIRIIPQNGAFLVCDFFNMWLFTVSGAGLLMALVGRAYRFDLILVQRKPATGWRAHLFPLLIGSPVLVYNVIGSIRHSDGPWLMDNGWTMCLLEQWYSYVTIFHYLTMHVAFIVIAVRVSRKRLRIFDEYWQSIFSFVMLVICTAIYAGVTGSQNHFYAAGRSATVIVFTLVTAAIMWSFLAVPLFNLLFRHERALAEFKDAISNRRILLNDVDAASSSRSRRMGSESAASPTTDSALEMKNAASTASLESSPVVGF